MAFGKRGKQVNGICSCWNIINTDQIKVHISITGSFYVKTK